MSGTAEGGLDPAVVETYRFPAIDPTTLVAVFGRFLRPLGFEITWPPRTPHTMLLRAKARDLPNGAGSEVTGSVFLERDLRVDRAETHRRDRKRWIGLIVGLTIGTPGWAAVVAEPSPHGPGGLAILAAVIGPVLALLSAISFTDADYWSDAVVVSYRGLTPMRTDWEHAMSAVTDYDVQVWVVRALSQDWESKYGSGRTILASTPGWSLEQVRSAIREGVTQSGPLQG